MRLRFVVRPKSFICPADPLAEPLTLAEEEIEELDDFPSVANCSYDSHNVAGSPIRIDSSPTMPIYADRNPLFAGNQFHADQDPLRNSPSHDDGAGQNVLFLDGHVEWMKVPVYGNHQDNIWSVEGVEDYRGDEFPKRPDDAFIIP